MIPTLVTCALVMLALGGCVVASMFVEERANARRLRRAEAERAADAPQERFDAVEGTDADIDLPVSAVPHDELARMIAAIDELEPTWTPTTGAAVVEPVAEQLRTAAVGGGSARTHVRLTPSGDGDAAGAATSAPEVHETV